MDIVTSPNKAQHITPVDSRDQVSEVDGNTLKSMLACSKILGLNLMKSLCEERYKPGTTEHDINYKIAESCPNCEGIDIQWLFKLNQEGIAKIIAIIAKLNCLKPSDVYVFFPLLGDCYLSKRQIHIEHIDWSSVRCRQVNVCDGKLILEEQTWIGKDTYEILLSEQELIELLYKDIPEELCNIACLTEPTRDWAIEFKIREANRSKLKCIGADLKLLFDHVWRKNYNPSYIRQNAGALIQIVMWCISNIASVGSKKSLNEQDQDIKTALNSYSKHLSEFFGNSKTEAVNNSSNSIGHSGGVADSSNSEIGAGTVNLVPDLCYRLFESLPSIKEQWNLARTSKLYLQAYNDFCEKNLKDEPEVKALIAQGWSYAQIFMHHPALREDRFVPCCQAGLNSLALKVLNSNGIKLIRNGSMSIAQSEADVRDFEMVNKNETNQYRRGHNRYSAYGFKLPENFQKPFGFRKFPSENRKLNERLIQFAVNSLQLTVEEAIKAKAKLSEDYFKYGVYHKVDVHRDDTAFKNVLELFVSNKLSVKRYLELTSQEIWIITRDTMCACIKEDTITLDSALSLGALIETYRNLGFSALEEGIQRATSSMQHDYFQTG